MNIQSFFIIVFIFSINIATSQVEQSYIFSVFVGATSSISTSDRGPREEYGVSNGVGGEFSTLLQSNKIRFQIGLKYDRLSFDDNDLFSVKAPSDAAIVSRLHSNQFGIPISVGYKIGKKSSIDFGVVFKRIVRSSISTKFKSDNGENLDLDGFFTYPENTKNMNIALKLDMMFDLFTNKSKSYGMGPSLWVDLISDTHFFETQKSKQYFIGLKAYVTMK